MNNVLDDWSLIPSPSAPFLSISPVDPPTIREAKIEFGDEAAARLKLSPDGKFVLWPQPSDDPEDPQNVGLFLANCH